MTGAGPLEIEQPRARDKSPRADERLAFTLAILPAYLRKSGSIEEPIPWLYLKGVATGDYAEALPALLGPDARGLSPDVIVRLKEKWGQGVPGMEPSRPLRRGVHLRLGRRHSRQSAAGKTRAIRSSACSA